MADQSELSRSRECSSVFNSAAPINRIQLFQGRKEQLHNVITSISTRGKHVVMFGDRGVGKTSLANILKDAIRAHEQYPAEVAKINCNESDSYLDVWRRILAEISVVAEMAGEDENPKPIEYKLSDWMVNSPSFGSGEIKKVLGHKCSEQHELVLIFDEVDRLAPEQRRLFADTIKDLSDSSTNVTIILIGVAHNVTDLIEEHKSIERCIAQVYMPPMAKYELSEIIDTGLRALSMRIDSNARAVILALSRGYPYYTHLLCYEAAMKAIKANGDTIKPADLGGAIKLALAKALASVREDYSKGADGQRRGTRYPIVLLAAALAETDDLGYFRPTDLKVPTRGGASEVSTDYSVHLNKLATDPTRGLILERRGTPRKYKFRFQNPLLRPYIIMKGIDEGLVGGSLLEQLGCFRDRQQTLFDDFE